MPDIRLLRNKVLYLHRTYKINYIMRECLSNFSFKFSGHGHYKVTYTSPKTNKQWCRVTNDMSLIDVTKNAENPKQKDLKILKSFCKS